MSIEYFPSKDRLLSALNAKRSDLEESKKAVVSLKLIRQLVEMALLSVPFDEQWYLAQNPDVAGAWRAGLISDLRVHYATAGYWEGRSPVPKSFDAIWYERTYNDVAAALHQGALSSAFDHYRTVGESEGRVPKAAAVKDVALWKQIL
jgi:hypothetical protein